MKLFMSTNTDSSLPLGPTLAVITDILLGTERDMCLLPGGVVEVLLTPPTAPPT